MHVSRQPNTERWVQSNSPLSLVFEKPRRLKASCGLIKASCGLIKPFGEGDVKSSRLRVRLTERNGGEMEKQVSDLVWRWEGETVSETDWEWDWLREMGVRECVCCVWKRGWGWVRVESDLCKVSGVIFENTLFEIEYQRLSFLAFHVEH